MRRSMRLVVKAIPRAVVLGVATLFQPKADPREHWSATAAIRVVVDAEAEAAGAPPLRRLPATA